MGSLMAGWDSPVQDPNSVKLMRNKSLTKERIEEYWKLKKKTEEEHLKAIATSPYNSESEVVFTHEDFTKEYRRSSSLPMVDTEDGHLLLGKVADPNHPIDLADLMKRDCWWTRSSWAFLNEPPVIATEVPKYKYTSQHQVATLATTKHDTRIPGM